MYQGCVIIKDHRGCTLYLDEMLEYDSFNDTSLNMCFNRVILMIEKERFIYFNHRQRMKHILKMIKVI